MAADVAPSPLFGSISFQNTTQVMLRSNYAALNGLLIHGWKSTGPGDVSGLL